MKYIISMVVLCSVSVILLVGSYYKTLEYDIEEIKPYISEMNFILNEYYDNAHYVYNHSDEYINRINKINEGIKNTKVSILTDDYVQYKILAIESFKKHLSYNDEKHKDDKYLKEYNNYNTLADKKLEGIIDNNFIKVTYLSTNSYYK